VPPAPCAAPAAAAPIPPLGRRFVSISSEPTPNPESLIFYPAQRHVLGKGVKPLIFSSKYDVSASPLAGALFKVKGVDGVMLAAEHVTVTKTAQADWELIQPDIKLVMSQFFSTGLPVARADAIERVAAAAEERTTQHAAGSLEATILELLDERVRPFVQQDGGDIEFDRFDAEQGAVYLHMHGACRGCPKSSVTLQMGVKNLLQHYVPEIKDVIAVEEEDEIPRPHR